MSPDVAARIDELKLSAKQAEVLKLLGGEPAAAIRRSSWPPARAARSAPINALRKKGLLTATVERLSTVRAAEAPVPRESAHELNADQTAALAAIRDSLHAAEHRTILIHGVTGSGKTEVYIQAIEEVVRFGRQAILLVPEISLTPQTVARFRARFDRVAVLHSHMSDVERHEHWRRIARGEVEVVVGARSAIFAPTPHLGADRARRGARVDVQAGIGAAVSRPRRGAAARGRSERAAGAGQRDAVARELASGGSGASFSSSRCRGACSTGRCRPCGRSTCATRCTASSRAARSAGRCTGRWTRRCATAGR